MFTRAYLDLAGNTLAARFRAHREMRESSAEGVRLLANHLRSVQDSRQSPPVLHDENPSRFYHTDAGFADVLEGLSFVCPADLQGVYNMLFPPHPDTPRYTQVQIMHLAQALLGTVERVVMDAPPQAPQNARVFSAVVGQIMSDLALVNADAKGDEIEEHTPGSDPLAFLGKVRAFNDALEGFVAAKKQAVSAIDQVLGGAFGPAPVDVGLEEALNRSMAYNEEAELERALALSMNDF
jgi:hypothetical protein